MKFIGKYGEYLVLLNLLQRDIEAYLAIKSNQEDYDITVVLNKTLVKRIQVKSTELQNKSTNNSISGIEKNYDYLALVIVDGDESKVFILTKNEAVKMKGKNANFSCSRREGRLYKIKESLNEHQDKWGKIQSANKANALRRQKASLLRRSAFCRRCDLRR